MGGGRTRDFVPGDAYRRNGDDHQRGLYFLNLGLTLVASKEPARIDVPLLPITEHGSHEHIPKILDSWKPWLIIAAALILVAYGPVFLALLRNISSAGSFAPW